jgi:hypothetical protein
VSYRPQFRVVPGAKVKLKDIDSDFKDSHENHKDAADEIERARNILGQTQAKTTTVHCEPAEVGV